MDLKNVKRKVCNYKGVFEITLITNIESQKFILKIEYTTYLPEKYV